MARPAAGAAAWSARSRAEPTALVARGDLLDELSRAHASGRIAVVSVLTGTRGVGKTQLAAAYARSRVEQGWPVVAWIPAEAEDQIVSGLAELGDLRGLRQAETDSRTAARDTLRWLQHQTGPCLLVYDNAGDPDLIGRWMPSVGNVHVVLTATRQAMPIWGGRCTSTCSPRPRRSRIWRAHRSERRGGRPEAGRRRGATSRWPWPRRPRSSACAGPIRRTGTTWTG